MKKFLVLFFTIFYVTNVYALDEKYVLVEFWSSSMIERGYPDNELIGGDIDVINRNTQIKLYSKKECVEEIVSKLINNGQFSMSLDKYYGNGVYYGGGFARFVCLDYNIVKKYIKINKDGRIDFFDLAEVEGYDKDMKGILKPSQFSKDFPDVIPYILKEEDIKNYTIFPLMKNQKEAKKLTNKLNEEVNNVLSKQN